MFQPLPDLRGSQPCRSGAKLAVRPESWGPGTAEQAQQQAAACTPTSSWPSPRQTALTQALKPCPVCVPDYCLLLHGASGLQLCFPGLVTAAAQTGASPSPPGSEWVSCWWHPLAQHSTHPDSAWLWQSCQHPGCCSQQPVCLSLVFPKAGCRAPCADKCHLWVL